MNRSAHARLESDSFDTNDSQRSDVAAIVGSPEHEFPVWGTLLLTIGVLVLVLEAVSEHFELTLRRELELKQRSVPNAILSSVKAMERDRLTQYRWVNRRQGIVRIPIRRAIDLVVRDYAQADTVTAITRRAEPEAKGPR